MEIFILVVTFLFGINLGWNAREMYAKQKLEELFSEFNVPENLTEDIIRIKIERDNGTFFAYHEENNLFIVQANTRAELERNLSELFPNKKFGCSATNLKECGFIS